jgi:hypothetical protein
MVVGNQHKRIGIIAGWQGHKALLEQAIEQLHEERIPGIMGIDDITVGPEWRECVDILAAPDNGIFTVMTQGNHALRTDICADTVVSNYARKCDVTHPFPRNGQIHGVDYLNPMRYAAKLDIFAGDPAIRTDAQAGVVFGWMKDHDYFLQIVGGGMPAAWQLRDNVVSKIDATRPLTLDMELLKDASGDGKHPRTRYIYSPGTLAHNRRYCVLELGDSKTCEPERIEPRILEGS